MHKYNHLGIPTTAKRPGERYLPQFKMYVSGYEDSVYKIEWMRFEPGCPLPDIVKTLPHVAFEVDNLSEALAGHKIIIQPNEPSDGVQVAFIEDNGAPVELMQFEH
ncbi:MAG: hypothetical protein GX631_08360 [Dehalococcoidales bacterium]|jgi:hypothetical protein|nr:hypothetical protein [Dehalococcoidales bacterium]